jgi:HK97 family phage major capsid protein
MTIPVINLKRDRVSLIDDARSVLAQMQNERDPAKQADLERRHHAAMRELDLNALDIEAAAMAANDAENRAAMRPGSDAETPGSDDGSTLLQGKRAAWIDQRGKPVRVLSRSERFGGNRAEAVGLGDLVRAKVTGPRNEAEQRALAAGTDSAGGFTVPTDLAADFIDRMRARSVAIAAGAQTVEMTTGTLSMARIETDPTCDWKAENAAIAEGDPTFSQVLFTARTLAGRVPMSRELLEDSLNIGAVIETAFAGAMATALDRAAIYGNGASNSPTGVWHTSGINAVSMGTNGAALTSYDPILDAILALKNANAADPTAMICAPRTEIALAKLKDGENRPLVAPDLVGRVPLLSTTSAPVDEEQGTAENASSLVIGDFRDLLIGLRTSLEIRIFDQPLAGNGQLLAVAWLRADIQTARPKSFCKLTGIIPAA